MTIGITGIGIYIPRIRAEKASIARAWGGGGRGELAVCSLDEDVITMGVEASQNALLMAGMDGSKLDAVYLATTTGPYVEGPGAVIVKTVLGCGAETEAIDVNSSTRAVTAALTAAVDSLKAGRVASSLVVAGDKRQGWPGSEQEMTFGAAAGALVLGTENVAAEIEASFSYSTYFLDRWKDNDQDFVEDYEPKFTRRYGYETHIMAAAKGLLEKTGKKVEDFDYVVLQATDSRSSRNVAQKLGIRPESLMLDEVLNNIGDTGNSSVLLGLARALEEAKVGQRVLLVSYGSGASEALSLLVKQETSEANGARSFRKYLESKKVIDYLEYLKKRELLQQQDVGAKAAVPPASPLLWRDSEAILQHLGAKCTRCGYVNYPPSQRIMCIHCGHDQLEIVKIAKKGKIHTFSMNYKLPAPLESPLPIIVADLEDGVRHRALGTEMGPNDLEVDMEVELVLRLISKEKGSRLYGQKYRLLR